MTLKTNLLAGGAIAPATMVTAAVSLPPMLRGPMVAYAPEDDGGAAIADDAGSGGEADVDAGDEFEGSVDGEEVDADDDFEEIEHEGVKHRVPKALKSALLNQTDYAQKAQALSARNEALQAEHAARMEQAAATEALLKEQAKVVGLDEQVAWYEGQDWTALQARDPDRAQELWMAYQQAKLRRDNAAKEFDGKRNEHLEKVRLSDAERLQKVDAELADPNTGIKGWGPELFRDLVGFAQTEGVSPAALRAGDAAMWKLIHKAYVGDKALKSQAAKQRHVQSQVTTPAATVAARSAPVQALSDRANTKAWMEARNAQVRKRA